MRLSRILKIIWRSKGEADNADRGLNNSDILRKPNSITLILFIATKNTNKKLIVFELVF